MYDNELGALKSRSTFTNGIDAKDVLTGRLDDAKVRHAVEVPDDL